MVQGFELRVSMGLRHRIEGRDTKWIHHPQDLLPEVRSFQNSLPVGGCHREAAS